MGAIVKTVCTSLPSPGLSYRDRGSEAVKKCLEKEANKLEALDVLISTGIYTDEHMHEPAFASLIQGRLSKFYSEKLKGTFSFDLHNGGGGSLMALRICSGFVASGKMQHGVIVAGDAAPVGGPAGALLLGKGSAGEGFFDFGQDSYPRYSGDYESYAAFTGKELRTFIHQDKAYLKHQLLCVKKSIHNFLSERAIGLDEIDLIIPSQHPPGFVAGLAKHYGKERLIELEQTHNSYSAGFILALAEAHTRGVFRTSKQILCVHAGPGITVELALYIQSLDP